MQKELFFEKMYQIWNIAKKRKKSVDIKYEKKCVQEHAFQEKKKGKKYW